MSERRALVSASVPQLCLKRKLDLFHVVLCIVGTNQWVSSAVPCLMPEVPQKTFQVYGGEC